MSMPWLNIPSFNFRPNRRLVASPTGRLLWEMSPNLQSNEFEYKQFLFISGVVGPKVSRVDDALVDTRMYYK